MVVDIHVCWHWRLQKCMKWWLIKLLQKGWLPFYWGLGRKWNWQKIYMVKLMLWFELYKIDTHWLLMKFTGWIYNQVTCLQQSKVQTFCLFSSRVCVRHSNYCNHQQLHHVGVSDGETTNLIQDVFVLLFYEMFTCLLDILNYVTYIAKQKQKNLMYMCFM